MRGSPQPIHLLHVEDNSALAEVLAEYLNRIDDRISVDSATSASEGLALFGEKEYDCIVSDYDMPGQNGIEFLEAVRSDNPDLPFILYTGKGSEEVASEAISAGVTDYLQKETGTSQYEVLANRIRNAVDQFHMKRELDRSQDLLEHTEHLADVGGWEADVKTGEQRWTDGTYKIHDIEPDSDFKPTVDAGVDFYHPDDQDKIKRLIDRCREEGKPYDVELRLITREDQLCWVRTIGEPIRKDGEIVIIRGAIKDITKRKNRERGLLEEKERYSTLVEQSHDGILVLQDAEIKFTNDQAVNILEYEESELLGKPFLDIVAPEDRDRIQDRYRRRLDPETESPPAQYDLQFLTKGGEQRYANISAAKIKFDGNPADLVTFRDITERKKHTRRLDTLINNLPGIVYRTRNDPDWPMEFVKGECKSLTGYPAEAIEEGEVIYGEDIIHPADQQEVWESVQKSLEEERPFEITYRIRTKEGATKWVWERGQFLTNQAQDAQILEGFITGITERKKQEDELRRHNERLDEFASVVSHDLRNPLNVAKGRLELIMEECESDHTETVAENLDRMETLISDVLRLARAGEAVGERESVELAELGQRCWHNVETKSGGLLIDTDAVVRADKTRLQQLIENLFSNAVEHGGDEVTVTVGTLDGGFYLEDDGPGIPEAELDAVFEAGYSSREGGTGFGLSIVKKIVEAHDWKIRVTEGAGGGARFEITGVEFVAE